MVGIYLSIEQTFDHVIYHILFISQTKHDLCGATRYGYEIKSRKIYIKFIGGVN